jgi:hypothetical protein
MGDTMKTIDVKSMLIGFLLCACGFLFTAQSSHDEYNPIKYDMSTIYTDGSFVAVTIMDVSTAKIVDTKRIPIKNY